MMCLSSASGWRTQSLCVMAGPSLLADADQVLMVAGGDLASAVGRGRPGHRQAGGSTDTGTDNQAAVPASSPAPYTCRGSVNLSIRTGYLSLISCGNSRAAARALGCLGAVSVLFFRRGLVRWRGRWWLSARGGRGLAGRAAGRGGPGAWSLRAWACSGSAPQTTAITVCSGQR